MKYREKLGYIALGAVLMLIGMLAAGLFSPLEAQNEAKDAEFGTITCRKLVVRYDGSPYATEINPLYVKVSVDGEESAKLGSYGMSVVGKEGKGKAYVMVNNGGGGVSVYGNGREGVRMGTDEEGGSVRVFGKDGREGVRMGTDEEGGSVSVHGKDGGGGAGMTIDEDGGLVFVGGKDGGGGAQMAISEDGGLVTVHGKDGAERAGMRISENGGSVSVFGKGNSASRAMLGVNEYGNGAVSTWDKNGYRFRTLK